MQAYFCNLSTPVLMQTSLRFYCPQAEGDSGGGAIRSTGEAVAMFTSRAELLRASKSFMKVDEMREAFFEFDIDGDGTITTKVSTLQNDFVSDPSPIIALCCYPNVNGAIRNLSLKATIFLLFKFNYFRENIWVRIQMQFYFLHIFVGRVDKIHKTANLTMLS